MRSVNQLIFGAAPGDAITQMALELAAGLRRLGPSRVYARFCHDSLDDQIELINELPIGRPGDVLVYHSSFGDPLVTRTLLGRPERIVLVYHNITPAQYFARTDPEFAAGLEWGRRELEMLRDRTVLNVAVSEYNASELRALGFEDVEVVPAGVRPGRLAAETPDPDTAALVAERAGATYVVGISQLLPHKRQDVLVQALHLIQSVHRRDVGLVLVGAAKFHPYQRALQRLADSLRVERLLMTGRTSDRSLSTILGRASVFVNASEHEGLGIPPLEAMSLAVPVVVRDAGATRDTVGDAALVLPGDAGPALFAEAIVRVLDDESMRATLVRAGVDHAVEFAARAHTDHLVDLIADRLVLA